MASNQDWFNAKIASLLQEDLRISTLSELKDHLASLPQEDASRISNILQLALVFDCLNDNNTEQVDLACDVLSLCLSNLTLGESTNRYGNALERALIHPYSAVKLMALKEIKRSLLNEEVIYAISTKTELIMNIISCLKDDDLAVVSEASAILFTLGITIPGINKITSSEILVCLDSTMQTNEITRLRIFEVIINISTQSDYSFKKLIDAKYMEKIICDLQNDDILLKMNIVEMLSELGQSEHGYVYLDKSRSLDKIISILTEDNLTMQLCEPGILKFFGHIAYKRPMEVMNQYDMLFNRLFMHLSCDDMTIFGISLDIIGHIGKTAEGKIALQSIDKIETAIKTVSSRLSSIPTDIKIRALSCLESLLRVTDNNNEITSLTHEWYSFIGANPMDVILRYAKNPFSELRLSGLGILNALANQTWGQEAIKNSAGLVEFLLDRNIESIKECKESKYEIIKLLSQSIIFDENTLERLQNFVKEGPFYVQALTEVAIEGN